jgi:uncharacterized protein (UPF0248 family)
MRHERAWIQRRGARRVITIEALLQRIRWDPEFGRGSFTIGYYDRLRKQIVTVPLQQIHLESGNHFSFTAVEADGTVHEVPFHRVRVVQRDGECIWRRSVPGEAG